MATAGIFTIITNDGKQDKMLMATNFLHERLRQINAFNVSRNGGTADSVNNLPTLLDIEKTHVLFTNAHFKPFAAIGFEYNKVKATAGNPSLGQTVQFSIPQFGDFFHDICGHVVMYNPTLSSTATDPSDAPLMRWCSYPGERLFKRVQQEVNGNPLDEYYYHATNMHREYRVAPNKVAGWKRCVGQEEPEEGWVNQPTWVMNGVDPSGVNSRVVAQVSTGSQTPSGQKSQSQVYPVGNLELFIPLLFWYNKDVRLAVPSVAIPYGQRFINIDLASRDELVDVVPRGAGTWASPNGAVTETLPCLKSIELYVNNIFVNPEVHTIYIKRIGFSLIRVHRQQIYNANSASQEVLLQQLKWPIEYMFVGMKLKAYHAATSAADKRRYLDRWHTFSQITDATYTTQGQQVMQTSRLTTYQAVPAATLGVALTGDLTGTATLAQALVAGDTVRVGGALFVVVTGAAAAAAVTGVNVSPAPNAALVDTVALASSSVKVALQGQSVTTMQQGATLDSITVKAHGISIYDNFPAAFFNCYTAYHYGGPNINVSSDKGLLFIPFSLYPGTYQPSGHINVSRAREFYVNYVSSVVSSGTEGSLVVIASAINFLLISDGSAVLRYAT
jgi:hypothetical protein